MWPGEAQVHVIADLVPGSLPPGITGLSFIYDLEREPAGRLSRKVHLIEREAVDSACQIGNLSLPEAFERDGQSTYGLESAAA